MSWIFGGAADHFGGKPQNFRERTFSGDHFAPIILVSDENRKTIILVNDHFGSYSLYAFYGD